MSSPVVVKFSSPFIRFYGLVSPCVSVNLQSRVYRLVSGRCMSTSPTPTPPPQCLMKPINVPMKTLMGPGPSNCPPRVLNANALPLLGHLHPEFTQIMDEIKEGIKYAFQTDNTWTVCVSGTGHAAMEASVCNLIEPGDKVLACVNGLWGERFAEMAQRHDGDVATIDIPMGTVFTLQDIENGLKENRPAIMFITHGESSGTTVQPLEGIGELCHKYNCILIVDSVAAMGGVPLFMDKWEIDVVYSGAQKVLSAPPGASPISFSARARQKVENRKTKVRSYYFDMHHLANYWGCDKEPRRYHHTGPISNAYALREGLARLAEESLENSWANHVKCVHKLHEGLESLGLKLFVTDKLARLPCVTGVVVPDGVNWKDVADFAMKHYRLEISGGLGAQAGKIWRIGLMGHNCTEHNVNLVLRALGEALKNVK
ncbi:alanine--glyoxylate aminotransferase-like isoform X2 [Mercenaria mercenaria]|uniref:alanine--glyoxylate aminotransferase-like isoform X2 n=1 Tax=Mercenaria mercenaria TaxID=6596 RepID=UPI00234F4EF8|nr:alanine--glyoxylate aminotransferase-like isoform X2 [Mercenaria mercenaria]